MSIDLDRLRAWNDHVPRRFKNALLSDLDELQDPAAIREWVDYGTSNLVLHGGTGIGKTHAAFAIGNHAADQGAWVEEFDLPHDISRLRYRDHDYAQARLESACRCDLLILDGLGYEAPAEDANAWVRRIADRRYSNDRRTIVTTALSAEEIIARYGKGTYERIADRATVVKFAGRSRRRMADGTPTADWLG